MRGEHHKGARAEAQDNKNGACGAHAIQGMKKHVVVMVMGDDGEWRAPNRELDRRYAANKKSGKENGRNVFSQGHFHDSLDHGSANLGGLLKPRFEETSSFAKPPLI